MIKYNIKQTLLLLFLFIALIILYLGYNYSPDNSYAENIWNSVDPISGIGAFIITLAVLYNQGRQKYLDSLEKRLSVDYFYLAKPNDEPKLIMQIEQAYLAGESDIRGWAQSLGGQQLTANNLSFDLHFKTIFERRIEKISKQKFLHYKIEMFLDEDPRKVVTLVDDPKLKDFKAKKLMKREEFSNSVLTRKDESSVWTWKRKPSN